MKREAQISQIPVFSQDLQLDLVSEVILEEMSSDEKEEIKQKLSSIIDEFSKEGKRIESD